MRKTLFIRFAWALAGLIALGGLAWVFGGGGSYYTDGIAIRQAAGDADVRLLLWEEPEPLTYDFEAAADNIEPVVSSDGRLMVFARGRAKENADLFTARWDDEAWSEPKPIEMVNSPADELGPELSRDQQQLYFYSDRPGGEGGYDIWVSVWAGSYWGSPVNLGPSVNSPFNEYDPALAPGDDRLYFSSNRPDSVPDEMRQQAWQATLRELTAETDYDIYQAAVMPDAGVPEAVPGADPVTGENPDQPYPPVPAFQPAVAVSELNTPFDEGQVDFTRRGDFVYFSSNREGGYGGFDIYRSRIVQDTFLEVRRVGRPVSGPADDMDPALWMEGHRLVFSSNRDADSGHAFALYQSTSREVFVHRETFRLALAWAWLMANKWLLLLLLPALVALWWLAKMFLDPNRRAAMDLPTRCLAASVLLHLVLLFLLSLWFMSRAIIEATPGPMEIAVNDAALARERLSLKLREEVTELKPTRSDLPLEQRIEHIALPEFTAAASLSELTFETPTPHDFVVAYEQPEETDVQPESPDDPERVTELPTLHVVAETLRMEMPEVRPVEPPKETRIQPRDIVVQPVDRPDPLEPAPVMTAAMQPAVFQPVGTVSLAVPPAEVTPTNPETELPPLELQTEIQPLEMAAAYVMESPETAPRQAPEQEKVVRRPGAGSAEPAPAEPETGSPLTLASEITSALLPSPEPLTGTLLSELEALPDVLDVVGEGERAEAELPELDLAGTVVMESKPEENMAFALRDPEMRKNVIEALGGSDETEAAINRALDFLVKAQEADGHWDMKRWGGEQNHDVAATGLALLCFMGHGVQHTEPGPHQDIARRAIQWLMDHLDDSGKFNAKDMYDQGIGTIALAEAYAMTHDPELKPRLEKAVVYIIKAQHPDTGGWRYSPGQPGDTSVFGWQVMALKSATLGGIEVPGSAFSQSAKWLEKVGGGQGGHYGYENRSPKAPMVAEGMFCQQLLGVPPQDPKMHESALYLNSHLPSAQHKDFYYWYYGCLSLYQHQGPVWEAWNERMRDILVKSQERGGTHAGSWNPNGDPHGNRMGRVVATALSTLSLEVYYRYLPMYSAEYAP